MTTVVVRDRALDNATSAVSLPRGISEGCAPSAARSSPRPGYTATWTVIGIPMWRRPPQTEKRYYGSGTHGMRHRKTGADWSHGAAQLQEKVRALWLAGRRLHNHFGVHTRNSHEQLRVSKMSREEWSKDSGITLTVCLGQPAMSPGSDLVFSYFAGSPHRLPRRFGAHIAWSAPCRRPDSRWALTEGETARTTNRTLDPVPPAGYPCRHGRGPSILARLARRPRRQAADAAGDPGDAGPAQAPRAAGCGRRPGRGPVPRAGGAGVAGARPGACGNQGGCSM